jgi:YesN/AraC family two-component response regulator
MTGKPIHILIVDDQPRARQGLRALIATWSRACEIREAANGREAIRLVEDACPDITLMDVRMPGIDGLQATREIKARQPQAKVILLSMYSGCQDEVLAAGAEVFLNKADVPKRLLQTLEEICPER